MTADPGPGSFSDPAEENVPAGPDPAGGPAMQTQAGTPYGTTGPSGMAHSPAMRAGTADRERAIDVLKAGFAEGRLSQDEHAERVARVHAARTCAELTELVSDLPVGISGAVMHYPAVAHQPAVPPPINSVAVSSLICGMVQIPTLGLSAVPAVILGSMARRQIRQTGERGEGLAVAGLILGWVGLACVVTALLGMMILLMLPPGPGAGGPIGG